MIYRYISISAILFIVVVGTIDAQGFGDPDESLYIPPRITVTDIDGREDGHGVEIETSEFHRAGWIGLIPVLFFDSPGDWTIPERYEQFGSSADAREYADTSDISIHRNRNDKYYEILNIIGYRMHRFPEAIVSLRGCYSAEGGESEGVAGERALVVREYLNRIWDIDTHRLPLLPPIRRADTLENNPKQEEARRVEFRSEEPAILAPVTFRSVGYTPAWSMYRVDLLPNMAPEQVDSIEFLMVNQNSEVVDRASIPGNPDSVRYTYFVRWQQTRIDDRETLALQVRLRGRNGRYRPSNQVTIPVVITEVDPEMEEEEFRRYNIPSGRYGDSSVDNRQREMIRSAAEHFAWVIGPEEAEEGYVVVARGNVDIVEDPARSATEVNALYADWRYESESPPPAALPAAGLFDLMERVRDTLENGTTTVTYQRIGTREEREEAEQESRLEEEEAERAREIYPDLLTADTIAEGRARAAIRFVRDSLHLPMLNADLPDETDLAQRQWLWYGYHDGVDRTDILRRGVQPGRGGADPFVGTRPEHRWYHRGLWIEFWTWDHVERLLEWHSGSAGES